MLPLITSHDIEVLMCIFPIVSVLRVAVELQVVFHFLLSRVPTGIVAGGTQHVVILHSL